ncbi:putative RNA methyltransferase [Nonomuraea roseola]|uniref:RNA methyltransferase n=1 Tax=Nonomuraea roseola TaxID=46179 RepID=A0ABV5PX93_9ACTN
MLADIVDYLACPVCRDGLRLTGGSLRCGQGHGFDVARQGYVSLLTGSQAPGTADSPAMVAARADFLAAGHYAQLAGALAEAVHEHASLAAAVHERAPLPADAGGHEAGGGRRGPVVVDAGAGTGYYGAAVLDALPGATGLAFDISKHAVKRAARAHPRMGAFVADVWKPLPIGDAVADVVIDVFAPRNGPEFARILRPGGRLVVVTPSKEHLSPLVEELGLLSVDEAKEHRVAESLRGFEEVDTRAVRFEMPLSRADVAKVVEMGPSAWHKDPDTLHHQIQKFPEWTSAVASFRLSIFESAAESRPSS